MRPYTHPGRLVRLGDGRRLHLKCMGRGGPTVILFSALGEWSETWRSVQPRIARIAKVCAWDRAGAGFSSGSTKPQTIAATTNDLEEALRRVHLRGPYVLVGHSLGGLESLRFADRHRHAVRGMVLVDPSIPDQLARFRRAAPAFAAEIEAANAKRPARLRICEKKIAARKIRIGSPDPDGCLSQPQSWPPSLAHTIARLDLAPQRWAAGISLSERFADDTRLAVDRNRSYGAMPLIVLSSSRLPDFPPGTPKAVVDDAPRLLAELIRAHDELAALSTSGINRSVPDSGHYIQLEHPDAVIAAVENVIRRSRRLRRADADRGRPLERSPISPEKSTNTTSSSRPSRQRETPIRLQL